MSDKYVFGINNYNELLRSVSCIGEVYSWEKSYSVLFHSIYNKRTDPVVRNIFFLPFIIIERHSIIKIRHKWDFFVVDVGSQNHAQNVYFNLEKLGDAMLVCRIVSFIR